MVEIPDREVEVGSNVFCHHGKGVVVRRGRADNGWWVKIELDPRRRIVAASDHYIFGATHEERYYPDGVLVVDRPDPPCSGPGFAHGPHGDCPGYSTDRT